MNETAIFRIGAPVVSRDGACGELTRVVIDPVAETVTHLVVQPPHGQPRLVPIDRATANDAQIGLDLAAGDLEQLEAAEETKFLPTIDPVAGYESGQSYGWPYYPLDVNLAAPMLARDPVSQDTTPAGKTSIRRGDAVQATDGSIGRVQGLVIDPRDQHLTHVLLQEGHLWGRKQVAIPVAAITDVRDGIQLSVSKEQVKHLPPVTPQALHWGSGEPMDGESPEPG